MANRKDRKIGRNDPCPCGSGKKLKHCHPKGYTRTIPKEATECKLDYRERSLFLAQSVASILKLDKGKDWGDVKRNISAENVRDIYRHVAYLYNPSTDFRSLLPRPDGRLKALYIGDIQPGQIERNILRVLLYVDQIAYVDPFLNPHGIRPKFNPLVHPEEYVQDTLKIVYTLFRLLPLIESGRLIFLPDPADFDKSLFNLKYKALADKDYSQGLPDDATEHLEETSTADVSRYLAALPEEYQRHFLTHSLNLDEKAQVEFLSHLKGIRELDPIALNQNNPNYLSQMQMFRAGTSDELSLWLCKEVGAFPYTDVPGKWQRLTGQLGDLQDGEWIGLTQAFQSLEFKFPNGVSPEFAERIRAEGRLESLRVLLRDIWKASKLSPNKQPTAEDIRTFKDRLTYEFESSRGEYDAIDSDLITWLGGGAIAGAVPALAAGTFSPWWPAGGLTAAALSKLWKSFRDRQAFNRRVPMSVFIDLHRGKRK